METCNYTKVDTHTSDNNEFNNEESIKFSWKPLFRQVLICFGLWITYILNGMVMGALTVAVPQIRQEANSTEAVSEEMYSWLMSVCCLSGLPWLFIYPIVMHYFGRKISIIIVSLLTFVGFVVFYFSVTVSQILISLVILSSNTASSLTILPVMVTEYTSPRYRGMFLTIKSASFFWGVWISNAIGAYFHWKVIGVLALVMTTYYFTVVFWPESPHWLATKGRFKECAESHRWLKGVDKCSEDELEKLIKLQTEFLTNSAEQKKALSWSNVLTFWKTLSSKEIYKPLLISALLFLHYFVSGKIVCSLYILDIVRKMNENIPTAYKTMLILDGVTVFGMYAGCILAKHFSRRTLMMISSIVTSIFLYILSIYLYLIKFLVTTENSLISISLLTMFSLGISCGPLILSASLYAELMPLRFKSTATFLVGIFTTILSFIMIKLAPSMFSSMGLHGSFLFYAIGFTICSLLLWKYLPETKDKTLQEIEEFFKE